MKWVPPKSEFSHRLSKTCQYWSCWKPRLKSRLWNVPTKKMPTGHMFASKKYLDLDLEEFWTIAGSGWCLSNRLNINGSHHFEAHEMCPWYSSNEVTTMAPPLKWPDSQHKRMQKKPVPSPLTTYETFSLSSYCPGLCEAFNWEAWVFLSCAAKVCKGYPMKKSRTPSNSWFMIHDANFQAQIASVYIILDIVACLRFALSYSSCLYKMDQKIQFPKSL